MSTEKKTNTDLLNLLLIIYIFEDISSLKKNNKTHLVHDKKEITQTPKHPELYKKLKVKSQKITEHLHLYICLSFIAQN